MTLSPTPREWRAIVSRCYYSAYNASRSVRFYVKGYVQLDADDHKLVGDLPDDFPDRLAWSNFATELRRDRNLADYEPWKTAKASLTFKPQEAVSRSVDFLALCKKYLRKKGLAT